VFRFFAGSPLNKKAETASDIVFWLVSGYLVGNFLNDAATVNLWFAFWVTIIMLIGVKLIIPSHNSGCLQIIDAKVGFLRHKVLIPATKSTP